MSQNDFVLANQDFPSMRTDLNNALQALASNSSGATAPSTTYAYQWWYDETTDILKIRNANNDAWINVASFDQSADTWTPYVGAAALTATAAELNQLDGDSTAALKVPVGTEAQRPTPAAGMLRFNDDDDVFEGYDGTAWGAIGGADFSSVAEDIIPDADSTRDIGSTANRWAEGWFDEVTTTDLSDGTDAVATTTVINGSAKAWVNFNGTGTIAVRESFNVSSLTDNGTGDYTVNFTNAMADANYAAICSAETTLAAGTFSDLAGVVNGGRAAGSVRVTCINSTNGSGERDAEALMLSVAR